MSKEELEQNEVFRNALSTANSLSTDELLEAFEKVEYKAFGFPAVSVWKFKHENYWQAELRNYMFWQEPKLECKGETAKDAIALLYAWCVYKGFLSPYFNDNHPETPHILAHLELSKIILQAQKELEKLGCIGFYVYFHPSIDIEEYEKYMPDYLPDALKSKYQEWKKEYEDFHTPQRKYDCDEQSTKS